MKHTDIKVIECRAAVAYCDVTGFTSWMNRAAIAGADIKTFIQKMKLIFREFKIETGFDTIPIGDGIIALIAAGDITDPPDILELILATEILRRQMLLLIRSTPFPSPTGFRIRIAGGIVYKTEEPPLPGPHVLRTFDFLGPCLNLGSRLLEFRRDLSSIITEEAYAMMSEYQRRKLIFETIEIKQTDPVPRGVWPEELPGLKSYQVRDMEKINVGKISVRKKKV